MTHIEAMKQALLALEDWKIYMRGGWDVVDEQAVKSLRQAIEEAEKRKPVAWWNGKESVVFMHEEISTPNWTDYYNIPLYTHSQPKREWVGLIDEEIQEIALEVPMDAVRITEAKLKEKNNGT